MNTKDDKFLNQVKATYEKYIDEKIGDSRLRDNMEHRAALSNALKPYTTTMRMGSMLKKDHSTIVYYHRQHLPLIQWSPQYRFKYGVALASTNQVAEEMEMIPLKRSYAAMEKQLKQLDDILDWVSEMKFKIEKKLAGKQGRS